MKLKHVDIQFIFTNNGKRQEYYYSGVDIYELFTSLNVEVPKHFMEYKDFKGFGLFD
jgi:hypothetical protein